MDSGYDVVIIGGALAGASMGVLLKREMPEARVLIVERSEAFDFKVGESTSEVAGCFLTRILRLGSWLAREQIAKNGLRFWFQHGDNTCLSRCAEMGPRFQVTLPAFQLDRSTLDTKVLSMAEEAGCEVWRPAVVRRLDLEGGGRNSLTVSKDGVEHTLSATWIVDASGRAAVIARQRGTLENLEEHPTASMWCRFQKVGDLDAEGLIRRHPELAQRVLGQRNTGTNHLTGDGWWAWIIPLQGGEVSVGLTWDRRLFQPPSDGSIPERLRTVLNAHPVGRYLMEDAVAVEKDARYYGTVAYRNKEVSGDGWCCVGDAAGFMDPLYSHGIDFIGNTVWAVHLLLTAALRGDDVSARLTAYNKDYGTGFQRWFTSLYKDKYQYLADAELMYAAVLMDIGCYFMGPVKLTYADHRRHLAELPYHGRIGSGVARFMSFYNRRLACLAMKRREQGTLGRRNLDRHYIFPENFTPNFKARKLVFAGIRAWLRAEISMFCSRKKSVPAMTPAPAPAPCPAPGPP